MFSTFFSHPLTKGLDLNAPETTELRKRIIREKSFLKQIYEEWYRFLLKAGEQHDVEGPLLELGSGAGFLNERTNRIITSEVFLVKGVSIVLDGQKLPFASGSLKGILMVNVLHHIKQPDLFLQEASRCIKPGGVIAMIEPWFTTLSGVVYRNVHHEPFDTETRDWQVPDSGPLSGANSAMPWIIFERDRRLFESKYPTLNLTTIKPIMPLRYLLAGGISLRSFMPGFSFPFWRFIENILAPFNRHLAMFACVVLTRTGIRHAK